MVTAAWNILCESAIFILIGFGIAGLLQAVISGDSVIRFLSGTRKRSVALAALIGLPLPLCSCSVLPAAVTLRQKGASKGATLSFLISTPETSFTSIMITYALLGPLMAIYRPIAACVTAIVAGLTENMLERRRPAPDPVAPTPEEEAPDTCSGAAESCGNCGLDDASDQPGSDTVVRKIWSNLRYAFVDLFDEIFLWILIGIVAAAVIQACLPPDVLTTILGGSVQSMLLMVVIGIPLYVCAEASTPIAAVLMLQGGLNPGAALVLLLVGPATNIGSVGVLTRLLGRRTVIIYLCTIVAVALVMGGILNGMVTNADLNLDIRVLDEPFFPSWLKTTGAILFLANGLASARRLGYAQRMAAWLSDRSPFEVSGRTVGITGLIVVAMAYAASGFYTIRPGESGIVLRFGAIRQTEVPPGLHYALPYPIERMDRVDVQRVRRLLIGFYTEPESTQTDEPAQTESWSLIGDENIADIKMAVHWGVKEDGIIRFQYGVADREELVRNAALGAAREMLGGASINTVFTTDRRWFEERIERLAQSRLEDYVSGIRIHSFRFIDTHAPPEVHAAFRDVASALEDRSTQINRARGVEARLLPKARGEATTAVAEAEGYAARTVSMAVGEADRFLSLLRAYATSPEIMRQRLEFVTLEEVWPKLKKYIKPPSTDTSELEIWFLEPDAGRMPRLVPGT